MRVIIAVSMSTEWICIDSPVCNTFPGGSHKLRQETVCSYHMGKLVCKLLMHEKLFQMKARTHSVTWLEIQLCHPFDLPLLYGKFSA